MGRRPTKGAGVRPALLSRRSLAAMPRRKKVLNLDLADLAAAPDDHPGLAWYLDTNELRDHISATKDARNSSASAGTSPPRARTKS
jgi:hypothetical protein